MWWWGLAWGATWVVDPSTTQIGSVGWPVRHAIVCPPVVADDPTLGGQSLHTLGVAAVIYSRKQGTMLWGHASVRAVGCLDGEPFDREYETYKFGPGNMDEVERVLAGESVLDDEAYLRRQRGALFRFRNDDPVDGGFFAMSNAHNREIYELWLPMARGDRDAIVQSLEAQLDDQLRRLRAREDLLGRYGALSTNCTMPLQEHLGADWHLPFRWLRELQDDAALRVIHPSHHLLAGWQTIPKVVERPTPIFRWRRDAGDAGSGSAPVLPHPH